MNIRLMAQQFQAYSTLRLIQIKRNIQIYKTVKDG